ncbi:hypothetical protein FGADI_7779 [Fusarium gaditjirri]|uniref:F-box domain-containing protein n=1 Tax=Fusarium gaditjirri TaxID=282569 RepID=A0A8H4T4B8_9HYPO|nr:hypothetical protein FGADI_7779 [Fusarium gaditjirri]
MASISVPDTKSMPDASKITQDITPNTRELVRTCFYKRSKYYFPTLRPETHEFSDEVRRLFSRCYKTETPNLGALACLPQDILEDIALSLDMDSFRRFRQVSRGARYLLTAITAYRRVLRYAPDALNALRRTDLSGHVSYEDVHSTLMTSKCAFCGLFGDFLFLPTAKRCCFKCLNTSPETAVVNEARIRGRAQWQCLYMDHAEDLSEALKSTDVRSFKRHNWDDVYKMSKTRGVLAKDLLAAYIKVDKTLDSSDQPLLKRGWLHYRLAASIIFPYHDVGTGKLRTGVSCKGCHIRRLQQSLSSHVPRVGGILSELCQTQDRSYSEDEAVLHFSECPEAQRIWRTGAIGDFVSRWFLENGGFFYSKASIRRRQQESLW